MVSLGVNTGVKESLPTPYFDPVKILHHPCVRAQFGIKKWSPFFGQLDK
jgi:hypothetical protein